MKIKTGQGNMTLQKLIAIYSISMVTSLPGLAISPILGKLESIFSSTSELQLQMLESLPSFIIVPFILLAGRMSLYFNTKKLLITGLAIFFACSIAYPFADRMWALLLISGRHRSRTGNSFFNRPGRRLFFGFLPDKTIGLCVCDH